MFCINILLGNSQQKWTAGVYLLMRSSPLIEYSSTVLLLCLWLGAITTVFSSLIGLFQQDIKKVIAYSTMSQKAQEICLFCTFCFPIPLEKNKQNFRHQTICVEIIYNLINSQITKARDINHINFNLFNSFTTMWLHSIMFEKRKVKFISKLVGISEAIRLILISLNCFDLYLYLLYVLLFFSKYIFSHYIFNLLSIFNNKVVSDKLFNSSLYFAEVQDNVHIDSSDPDSLNFNEWLAGLIDGDGYFLLTKKGYVSCEICMDVRDKKALYSILHKYGGSIKPVSGAKALKYKLRNKKGLLHLIKDINGLIRNPARLLQINKLCNKYEIELKYPKPLTYNNGWLSGFIDSDGSIYLNEKSGQLFISITQKNIFLLEPLISLYGGRIDIHSYKSEAFKYVIYRKSEQILLIDNYFSKYPLKTEKVKRVNLIKQFYNLRTVSNNNKKYDINKLNTWLLFKDKWENFKD